MIKKLFLILSLISFIQSGFSQNAAIKNNAEVSAETKKQAIALLRETFGEVNNLRTLENRIGFSSELAAMLWYSDEKESRAMFTAIIGDFNQLIAQYNAQLSTFAGDAEDLPYYGGPFLGGGDQDEKTKSLRKLVKAMGVRQQIASSLAEHDAKFAFDFYDNSLQLLTNAKLRKRFEEQDVYFQSRLLQKIAENDPSNALGYGRKSLAKGLNYGQIDLLKKLYAKDADKGAEFAQAITDKIKSGNADGENFYILNSFIQTGAESLDKSKKDNKKPMFSEENMRDLTEIQAQKILQSDESLAYGDDYIDVIEKYSPSRGAQIRAKLNAAQSGRMASNKAIYSNISPPPVPNANRMSNSNSASNRPKDVAGDLANSLKPLDEKALPKEERDKVVAQARKLITEEMPSKLARITALGALAAQISKLGDKELADQIMNDAQTLVNLQPKSYQDYIEVLMLVSGYSQTSPDKAFPVLDESIYRINETIAAMIKVGEFFDASNDMIDGGEVQLGSLGSLGEITSGLAIANGTIRNLAIADFDKTRALTNRFDRPEARILAKMLVLRAILGDKAAAEDKKEVIID